MAQPSWSLLMPESFTTQYSAAHIDLLIEILITRSDLLTSTLRRT